MREAEGGQGQISYQEEILSYTGVEALEQADLKGRGLPIPGDVQDWTEWASK